MTFLFNWFKYLIIIEVEVNERCIMNWITGTSCFDGVWVGIGFVGANVGEKTGRSVLSYDGLKVIGALLGFDEYVGEFDGAFVGL